MESLQSVTRLIFEGINYRAAVWVNGHLLASPVGTFRTFPIDISAAARAGDNAVAVQITRPFDRALPSTNHDTDLAISFVDWSPAPPDGNMGLWMPVLLAQHPPAHSKHLATCTRACTRLRQALQARRSRRRPQDGLLRLE